MAVRVALVYRENAFGDQVHGSAVGGPWLAAQHRLLLGERAEEVHALGRRTTIHGVGERV